MLHSLVLEFCGTSTRVINGLSYHSPNRPIIACHWYKKPTSRISAKDAIQEVIAWVDKSMHSAKLYGAATKTGDYRTAIDFVCLSGNTNPRLFQAALAVVECRCNVKGLKGPFSKEKIHDNASITFSGRRRIGKEEGSLEDLAQVTWKHPAAKDPQQIAASSAKLKQWAKDSVARALLFNEQNAPKSGSPASAAITLVSYKCDFNGTLSVVLSRALASSCEGTELAGPFPERKEKSPSDPPSGYYRTQLP